ncbi:hypothetical protein TKK_0002731 [Trichogramma kaykai]|uniref:EGF-like domain-containing protein n=1 Tax=Trichogramma kaykai TaxID=54128 RepID=A0ABD2XQU5_9HYME
MSPELTSDSNDEGSRIYFFADNNDDDDDNNRNNVITAGTQFLQHHARTPPRTPTFTSPGTADRSHVRVYLANDHESSMRANHHHHHHHHHQSLQERASWRRKSRCRRACCNRTCCWASLAIILPSLVAACYFGYYYAAKYHFNVNNGGDAVGSNGNAAVWDPSSSSSSTTTTTTTEIPIKVKETIQGSSLLVIQSERDSLWTYHPERNQFSQLLATPADCRLHSFDVYRDRATFWTGSCDPARINSVSADEDRIGIQHTSKLNASSLAVDHVTGNIYLVDRHLGTLSVMDQAGRYHALLLSELAEPRYLELDPESGVLFVLQSPSKASRAQLPDDLAAEFLRGQSEILRADMDGADARVIVANAPISALAVDVEYKNLFWSVDFDHVFRTDYEGDQRTRVIPLARRVISMAVLEDTLYSSEVANVANPVHDQPVSNVLRSCQLAKENTCMHLTSHEQLPFRDPGPLRTWGGRRRTRWNPCAGQVNGGCEHLCLKALDASRTCRCAIGWRLAEDGRSCVRGDLGPQLVYLQGGYVRAKTIDPARKQFTDFIWPTSYADYVAMDGEDREAPAVTAVSFDYDPSTHEIFISNGRSVYKMNVSRDEPPSKIFGLDDVANYVINDLSVDTTENHQFYYIKHALHRESGHNDSVARVDTLKYNESHFLTIPFHPAERLLRTRPYSLVLDLKHRKAYFTADRDNQNNVHRVDLYDAAQVATVTSDLPYYNPEKIVAIDYRANRLYYVADRYDRWIVNTDLNGRDERRLRVPIERVRSLSVHEDWLYVANATGVWQLNKTQPGDANATSLIAPTFETYAEIVAARVFYNWTFPRVPYLWGSSDFLGIA